MKSLVTTPKPGMRSGIILLGLWPATDTMQKLDLTVGALCQIYPIYSYLVVLLRDMTTGFLSIGAFFTDDLTPQDKAPYPASRQSTQWLVHLQPPDARLCEWA